MQHTSRRCMGTLRAHAPNLHSVHVPQLQCRSTSTASAAAALLHAAAAPRPAVGGTAHQPLLPPHCPATYFTSQSAAGPNHTRGLTTTCSATRAFGPSGSRSAPEDARSKFVEDESPVSSVSRSNSQSSTANLPRPTRPSQPPQTASAAAEGDEDEDDQDEGDVITPPPQAVRGSRHQGNASAAPSGSGAAAAGSANASSSSSSSSGSIYSRPELYDAAFSYRVFKDEIKFLRDAYKKHTGSARLKSVLELGCGPARHSIGLAKAGVPSVTAVDLSPEMLYYASKKAGEAKIASTAAVSFVRADMTTFELPGQQFDMVMVLLGTFSHLQDNASASKCFAQVVKHLRPGGLFVLELAHPGDLFDGTFILGDGGKEIWEVPFAAGRKLLVEWGAEFDNFDPVTQILYRTVTFNVLRGEDVEDTVEEVVPYRQYTVQEVDLLAGIHGLTVEGMYGEMNLGIDLNHEEAYRMVIVLKRQ